MSRARIAQTPVQAQDEESYMLMLGKNIALRRKQLDMTQTELGAKTGFGYAAISLIEHGKNTISAKTLPTFAAALNWSLADLVEGRAVKEDTAQFWKWDK